MELLKADILVTWPRNMDYPLFRLWLDRNKQKYNKLIVSWTGVEENEIHKSIGYLLDPSKSIFIDGERNDQYADDWRNAATNSGLDASTSEWVWFLEPDFFMEPDMLYSLSEAMETNNCIGFHEANRLHPACLLVKRDLIEKTSRNFSADHARQLDHFCIFTEEVERLCTPTLIDSFGVAYYHMQGVTHNYSLLRQGEKIGYKPDEFYLYNQKCLELQPKQCIFFQEIMEKIEREAPEIDFQNTVSLYNLIERI